MRLSAWMKKNKVGDEALATKTGVDRVTINRVKRGIHRPSWGLMITLAKVTNKQVRPNDFEDLAANKP